jgi:hypothetical protein
VSKHTVAGPLAFMLACVSLSLSAAAQESNSRQVGYPDDWSHHHLVFSNPGTLEDALRSGTRDQWQRITSDPRYRMQQMKRSQGDVEARAAGDTSASRQLYEEGLSDGGPSIANIGALHRDWSMDMGSGATVGVGQYPAKYSFVGSPSCGDFVVYNTNLAGASTQASLVAYSNIYSRCTGTVPSVYWGYNTSSGSNTQINNSVVLSEDGSQVAFIQNVPAGSDTAAMLVLLKWKAHNGSVGSPVAPSNVANSAYRTCTAPCMTTLTFTSVNNGNNRSTLSAPFYDYADDILYVGDDGPADVGTALLHKFTGVFNGTPAEVTASPWPVAISDSGFTANPLGLPVYDSTSGNVLVPDNAGLLHSVTAATGVIVGVSSYLGQGINDGPLVDSTAARAYVFTGQDLHQQAGLFQFPTSFTSGSGTEVTLGSLRLLAISAYVGTFDNAYYTSNGSAPTGDLYACGVTATRQPALYQIAINANTISQSGVKLGPGVATFPGSSLCSPITEIYNSSATNGPFDWIYLGVPQDGSPAACSSGGCIMNFVVTEWTAGYAYSLNQEVLDTNLNIETVTTAGTSGGSQQSWNATQGGTTSDGTVTWTNEGSMGSTANSTATPEAGGTSGIIVDGTSSEAGASQVYFSTLADQACSTSGGTGGCAIQAAQSAP